MLQFEPFCSSASPQLSLLVSLAGSVLAAPHHSWVPLRCSTAPTFKERDSCIKISDKKKKNLIPEESYDLSRCYLQLDEDVWGQRSTVAAVHRTGHHSLLSLFSPGSGGLLLGVQGLHHRRLSVLRVWSRWTAHSLHDTIVSALPLTSNECWRRKDRK